MAEKNKQHTIDVLFVLILFCVFTLSVIALTGTGAGVYSKIVDGMSANYDARTSCAYISGKIHRADTENGIELGKFGDSDAILLLEEIDNLTYCTYIYCYDGAVMELFTRLDHNISPEYGTKIMDVSSFEITKETDSLYKINISAKKGDVESLYVHIRSSITKQSE